MFPVHYTYAQRTVHGYYFHTCGLPVCLNSCISLKKVNATFKVFTGQLFLIQCTLLSSIFDIPPGWPIAF